MNSGTYSVPSDSPPQQPHQHDVTREEQQQHQNQDHYQHHHAADYEQQQQQQQQQQQHDDNAQGNNNALDTEMLIRSEGTVPMLEQMGLEKLDESGLRMLLQHAYEIIQEKERGVAAIVGQDLLETNTTLQTNYQRTLTRLRQQRMHRPRQLTPPRRIILSPAPEMMSGSLAIDGTMDGDDGHHSDNENWVDFEPSRPSTTSSSLHASPNSGHSSSHHLLSQQHHVSYRRSTGHHTNGMRSRSRQDIEKMATLEDLNTDLQVKVDAITKELKQARRQAFKRHRKAELELKTVKGELERTTSKVVDLEEQNGRLIEASRMIRMRRIQLQKQLPTPGSIPGSTMANMAVEMQGDETTIQEMLAEDSRIFEELRDRIQSMERKNTALLHQKIESDKRAQQLAQDAVDSQKDYEEILMKLAGYSGLQSAYDAQSAHVKELESSLEELQNRLSTMSSRLSQMNSPLMSPSVPSSPVQSYWHREDADFKALKTIMHGAVHPPPMVLKSPGLRGQSTQQRRPRRTLLAELESEWFRDVSFFGPPRVVDPQQASPQQKPIHLGLHAPKSPKALKDHRHESDSEMFSDDTGGRVKGWRERIQDMDEESACESSSCIRKRHNRFKFSGAGSDTEGHLSDAQGGGGGRGLLLCERGDGDDSDVERYQLHQRRHRKRHHSRGSLDEDDEDDEDMSDCSDPHHLNYGRPSTPGCCCHLYDDYSGYSSYDDEEESVVGWAHFEDYDASSFGYDMKRDGYYLGRRSRRGLFGMIQSVYLLFRLVWRWCRFICILSTALGIAIYRGPDALLTDGH
ncbi:hypothetical protein EDD11_004989 [Mortierella claussenii]|nr:hypothetical protein EDD11_004989 [Mortierella claussenii]